MQFFLFFFSYGDNQVGSSSNNLFTIAYCDWYGVRNTWTFPIGGRLNEMDIVWMRIILQNIIILWTRDDAWASANFYCNGCKEHNYGEAI